MECRPIDSLLGLTDGNDLVFDVIEVATVISSYYASVHQTLSLLLCFLGIVTNLLHIAVLSPPSMRKNAVNRLLSCVAAFEIATMVLYTVFALRFGSPEMLSDPAEGFSFRWTAFLAFYSVASIAIHSITLYLVVTAAFIRYWSVRTISSKWRHHNVSRTVALISTAIAVLCIPTFLLHSIVPTSDAGRYRISLSGVGSVEACSLFFANLWITGVFFKVLPCLLMLLFTVALLRSLSKSRKCRRVLLADVRRTASVRLSERNDHTTKIMVVLLSTFLLTELPQGILSVANALFPQAIYWFVYLNFGELLDLLSLVNCNVCFVAYVSASPRYRASLKRALAQFALHLKRAAASVHLLNRSPSLLPTAQSSFRSFRSYRPASGVPFNFSRENSLRPNTDFTVPK